MIIALALKWRVGHGVGMAFKGKPSINKRNREIALRERQKEKEARREQRAATKREDSASAPALDPSLSPDEQALREFQLALKERAADEAADIERDLQRKK
jgi:hypothetical protein